MGSKSNVDAMQFESDIVKILVAITLDHRSHLDYRIARVKSAISFSSASKCFSHTEQSLCAFVPVSEHVAGVSFTHSPKL